MEEERGKSFSEIWKEELDRLPEDLPMRNEDLQALRSLGENLGYADKTTQERTILFYLEQADDSLAFLKKGDGEPDEALPVAWNGSGTFHSGALCVKEGKHGGKSDL